MHVQVTRQLFTEFVKQLIHWFTSNQQKENPETMALLDAILDGLVDPENGSLRSFYQPQLFHGLHGKATALISLNHCLAVVDLGFYNVVVSSTYLEVNVEGHCPSAYCKYSTM